MSDPSNKVIGQLFASATGSASVFLTAIIIIVIIRQNQKNELSEKQRKNLLITAIILGCFTALGVAGMGVGMWKFRSQLTPTNLFNQGRIAAMVGGGITVLALFAMTVMAFVHTNKSKEEQEKCKNKFLGHIASLGAASLISGLYAGVFGVMGKSSSQNSQITRIFDTTNNVKSYVR
jgi:formate hydrogenlyase subunit 3/multisubunit Na+/H+ antiporter MnhD subunit